MTLYTEMKEMERRSNYGLDKVCVGPKDRKAGGTFKKPTLGQRAQSWVRQEKCSKRCGRRGQGQITQGFTCLISKHVSCLQNSPGGPGLLPDGDGS